MNTDLGPSLLQVSSSASFNTLVEIVSTSMKENWQQKENVAIQMYRLQDDF